VRVGGERFVNAAAMPLRHRIAAALTSAALLAAVFPRIDLGFLAWFALVPLLLALRGLNVRQAALVAWLTGFAFFPLTVYWIPDTISNFTRISPVFAKILLVLLAAAAAYGHLFFGIAMGWANQARIPRIVAAPVAWVIGEWLRTFLIAGFPWNLLGYSQVPYVPIAQAADIGGVYLISAVLVLASAAIADAVEAWPSQRRRSAARIALAAAIPLLVYVYGEARLANIDRIPYSGSIRIGIAQGNIAQSQKWDAALRDRILAKYLELTEQAASAGARLVVWPEAAVPFSIRHDMRALELSRIARGRDIELLVGVPGFEQREGDKGKPYNQAWLVGRDGAFKGSYDKIQLVPFGEYIPLYGLFGMVDVAVQSVGQLGKGQEYTIFETLELEPVAASQDTVPAAKRPARFATLICYEGIFPELTRQFASRGADFLVNISNDAWYGDTAAAEQHLAMAAMRSIENRMPLVRSTNTGISAFVTDEGRIGPTTPLFHEDMMVETVLVRPVWSFYRAYGDVFLHLCQAAAVLMFLLAWRARA